MNRFLGAILVFVVGVAPLSGQPLRDLYDGLGGFTPPAGTFDKGENPSLSARYEAPYLVLRAEIKSGWHLYAFTQKPGGTMPSRLTLDEGARACGPIRPTTAPHVETVEYFDVPLESFEHDVTWLIPIVRPEGTPAEAPVHGTLKGQVCANGPGGTCVPFAIPFAADNAATSLVNIPPLTELLAQADKVPAVFSYTVDTGSDGMALSDPTPATPGTATVEALAPGDFDAFLDRLRPREVAEVGGIGLALVYALLGGLILNVMPCVLPVIGLKILSFFEQAGHNRVRAFALNLWYALGLLTVFLVLAAMNVGLSRMFTSTLFAVVIAAVVFAMSLSLLDVWELSAPAMLGRGKSVRLMQREGAVGAFFKGIITTLLAIPCGAPLLSPAIAWGDAQIRSGHTEQVFLLYGTIGLGMALPYLLIGANPKLLRFLPQPGEWMDTFKKIMGFALLVAVVWILSFIDLAMIVPTVALLCAVGFACWMVGRLRYIAAPFSRRVAAWGWSLAVFLAVLVIAFDLPGIPNRYTLQAGMQRRLDDFAGLRTEGHWIAYTPKRLGDALHLRGKTVLVDFTASWCLNCKVLEATVLESDAVLQEIDRRGIVSLQADCSEEDSPGSVLLRRLGPHSVPALAIFTPERPEEPIVIRGNYVAKTLLDQLP